EFANDRFEVAVISGDPTKPGPFTIRFKAADGTRVAPHWHPGDEHLTILQGSFNVGMGDKFDKAATKELAAGAYAVMPKRMRHFAWCKGETIVQAHGTGPFKIVWVDDRKGVPKKPTQ
ncbi:MAG: cupin domain-containing protein, partial [Candidatus Rokubacteria bacterium]|nr:cupin domain-containing protein [Candidatus Rokubacteria bacterium]